jgi:AraC-like DNA-binding protein
MTTRWNRTGTASAVVLRGLLRVARERGVDVDALLRELGVPTAAVDDIEYRIPEATRLRAWTEVETRSRDPFLGLHVAEAAHVGTFDVLDYVLYFSATFGCALDNLVRYHRLLADAWAFRRVTEGETTRLRRVEVTPPQEAEAFFAFLVVRGRVLLGVDLTPSEVKFAHPSPADTSQHAQLFRCPVHFGVAVTELLLPTATLDLPVVTSNPDVEKILERYTAELIERQPKDDSFVERVRSVVARTLRSGPPSLEATARALKASPRTVQRKLGEHGTTHLEIVDSVRSEMASQLVEKGNLSLTEIAFLVGFTDVSGFQRAYKRWTGTSPSDVRARARSGAPRA